MEQLINLIMTAAVMVPLAGSFDGEPDADAPALDEVYADAAMYLPADTMAVVGSNHTEINTWIDEYLLPFEVEGQSSGSTEGFAEDVHAAHERHLGMNPLEADEMVVGMSMEGMSAVFFGDYEQPTAGETMEIAGHTVQQVTLDEEAAEMGAMVAGPQMHTFYMLAVDAPRPAVVMATSENLLEMVLVNQDMSLAGEAGGDSLAQMAQAAADDQLMVAMDLMPMQQMMQGQPLPDAGVMSYGDRTVRLHVQGMDDGLRIVEESIAEALEELVAGSESIYEDKGEADFLSRMMAISAYHSTAGLQEQLAPTHEGNSVSYGLRINETPTATFMIHLASLAYTYGVHSEPEEADVLHQEPEEAPPVELEPDHEAPHQSPTN